MGISDQAEGGSILSRSVYTPFMGEADEDHSAQLHSRAVTEDATSLPSLLPFAPFTWLLGTSLFPLPTTLVSIPDK